MAFQVGRIDDAPRPTRNKTRVLENTEEWLQTKTKLADGLKPYEAFWITFTPEDKHKFGVKAPGRTFKDMLRRYLKQMGLKYDVDRYLSEGKEIVRVSNPVIALDRVQEQTPVAKKKRAAR